MLIRARALISLTALLVWGSPSEAFKLPGSHNCPTATADSGKQWTTYLSGGYGDKEPPFSIRFSEQIGGIKPRCYSIYFHPESSTWAFNGEGGVYYGRDGAPSKYEVGSASQYTMNIGGVHFIFNYAGEVMDPNQIKDGHMRKVGQMVCIIGSEC